METLEICSAINPETGKYKYIIFDQYSGRQIGQIISLSEWRFEITDNYLLNVEQLQEILNYMKRL